MPLDFSFHLTNQQSLSCSLLASQSLDIGQPQGHPLDLFSICPHSFGDINLSSGFKFYLHDNDFQIYNLIP